MIDPNTLADNAKAIRLIYRRDLPHEFRPSPLYAGRCDFAPLALAGNCHRKRNHPLHRK